MNIGLSSSCFYPLETEKSIEEIGKLGIKTSEIFFNSPIEMESPIINEVIRIKNYYEISIDSVHPCTSSCEPFFFFSDYERRFIDMLEFYKRYMESCNKLGAEILIIHGARDNMKITQEEYFERFSRIYREGKKFGVTVAQENVFRHKSGDPEFLKKMKKYMKDDFKFVFDLKQMRRCAYKEDDFLNELLENIVNVHISDSSEDEKCLPPGEGNYNLKGFIERLKSSGYNGNCLIELYRSNYNDYSQLKDSYEYLTNLI